MADLTLVTDAGKIDVSGETQADLSALQYHFVKRDSNELIVACGANEKPLGILQNAPDGSTNAATAIIRIQGVSKLKMDEACAFGNYLTCTATSKGEVADAAGEDIGARALTSADDGDLAQVQLLFGEVEASDA